MTDISSPTAIESDAVRAALELVLASRRFAGADRRSRFLNFLVSETLAGRAEQLKGYTIGLAVFEKPSTFDPTADSLVRVEAGRLRDKLREYYQTEGLDDPIRIDLPTGTYVPTFTRGRSNGSGGERPVSTKETLATASAVPTIDGKSAQLTVAVLPFVNLSIQSESNYFSDGLTDSLITDLSKVSGLFVISRHSSFAYKGSSESVSVIANRLGVRYVVEGGVCCRQDKLRVTARLVDAGVDHCLWADRYDREFIDMFEVQDDLSRSIVKALKVKLTPYEADRLGHEGTRSKEAHDALLRGLEHFWLYTRESCAAAQAQFRRATEIDPNYAAAHAWLARSHVFDYSMTWVPDYSASMVPALAHARRACELDDLLPFAHAVMCWALLWDRNPDRSIAEGRRACTLDPNSADACLFLSVVLSGANYGHEALQCIEKGIRLNPHPSAFFYWARGRCHFVLEDYESAIADFQRGISVNPHFIPNHAEMSVVLALAGRLEEGLREVELAKTIWPKLPRPIYFGDVLPERFARGQRLLGWLDS